MSYCPVWSTKQNLPNTKMSKCHQIKKSTNMSNQNKPRSGGDDNAFVGDLLHELESVLNEKVKLENENKSLKEEIEDLNYKNDMLAKTVHINKNKFDGELLRLQEMIKEREVHLFNNSEKCLEEQERRLNEIKALKAENEKLSLAVAKAQIDYSEQLKSLESELKILQLNCENLKNQNEDNVHKSVKYKNKLKHAISIINDLNNIVVQHTNKPECIHSETQTGEEEMSNNSTQESQSIQCYCTNYSAYTKTEDLLLADIFFKPKLFCENELPTLFST